MTGFTIDGNRANNSIRDYTGNIFDSYWGFGAVICNIRNLNIQDIKIKDTEAWGISYWLCENVVAKNLQFDQDETSGRAGYNEDGITGSAKNIHIENVQGFTNDDMIGITTGTASLRGNDCGVSVNININSIVIKNIVGKPKNGISPYSCIGIYGDKAATIDKVSVEDVNGDFVYYHITIADYWPNDIVGKPKVGTVHINSLTGKSSLTSPIGVKSIDVDNLYVNNVSVSNDINITNAINCTNSTINNSNLSNINK